MEMEVRRSRNGKRLFSVEQKKQILSELEQGLTAQEVSRKYELPVQALYKWRRRYLEAGERALKGKDPVVPLTELKKAKDQIKQLHHALGKMTLERDILKDAVEIAREKKWI